MKLDKVRSWSINCYRFHLVDDLKSCFSSLEKLKWPCDPRQRAIKQIGGDLQNSCTVTHLSKCPAFLEIGWKLDWFTLTHRDGQCLQFLQLTLLISCNSSLAALFEPLFEDISCPASITVNIRSLIECQKIRNLVEKKTMLWNTRIVLGVVAFSDRPEPQKMEMWVNGKTSNTLGRSFSRCSQFAGNTEIQTKGESSSSSCCRITALACSVIENSDGGQWGGGRTL